MPRKEVGACAKRVGHGHAALRAGAGLQGAGVPACKQLPRPTAAQSVPQTYAVHTDSVWALLASEDWSSVYSGGRDACVYRTHLASRTAELVLQERGPLTSVALDKQVCVMFQ